MHPLLLSRARLGAYLLGWALMGVIQSVLARLGDTAWSGAVIYGLLSALAGALVFLPSYYPCRALPLARTPPTALLAAHLGSCLFLGTAWASLVFGGLYAFPERPGNLLHAKFFVSLMALGLLFALIMVGVNYLLIAQVEREEAERTEQELRVLARDAELKALRAQLNPHFLFNSLNSISALTTLDAGKAREMCVLLADFLRKSLKLGEQREVPLQEETDLLRSYLSIEQIRFGKRLQVEWDIHPDALAVRIPALLLQPLVENAIKHGIAQIPEGGTIRIAATVTPSLAEIRVENPLDVDSEPPVGLGMGLRQVRQRLLGWYGEDIRFEAGAVDGMHLVRMSFPRTRNEN